MKDILVGFDLDGTITDTTEIDDLCFTEVVMEEYGVDLKNFDWANFTDVSDWGLIKDIHNIYLKKELSQEELTRIGQCLVRKYEQYHSKEAAHFSEVDGSVAFIKYLQEQQYPVAVATGSWKASALFKASKVGLDLDELPFGHSDIDFTRPGFMRYAFDQAEQKHQMNFSKIVYFGDGVWDFKTCKAMNLPLIGVDFHGNGNLKKAGQDVVIHNYLDKDAVLEIIEERFV